MIFFFPPFKSAEAETVDAHKHASIQRVCHAGPAYMDPYNFILLIGRQIDNQKSKKLKAQLKLIA
jgi:hypothetical protein